MINYLPPNPWDDFGKPKPPARKHEPVRAKSIKAKSISKPKAIAKRSNRKTS